MCERYNRNSALMRSVITRFQCSVMYWLLQLRQELVFFHVYWNRSEFLDIIIWCFINVVHSYGR